LRSLFQKTVPCQTIVTHALRPAGIRPTAVLMIDAS